MKFLKKSKSPSPLRNEMFSVRNCSLGSSSNDTHFEFELVVHLGSMIIKPSHSTIDPVNLEWWRSILYRNSWEIPIMIFKTRPNFWETVSQSEIWDRYVCTVYCTCT